jgi:hypothetical protein
MIENNRKIQLKIEGMEGVILLKKGDISRKMEQHVMPENSARCFKTITLL